MRRKALAEAIAICVAGCEEHSRVATDEHGDRWLISCGKMPPNANNIGCTAKFVDKLGKEVQP